MSTPSQKVKRRIDYHPPGFLIKQVELSFNLDPDKTKVKCVSRVFRNGEHDHALELDGEQLTLVDVKINGKSVPEYQVTDSQLIIENVPDEFNLEIYNEINPSSNSSLEGLYMAAGSYCTQCEAEGFRKITYFLDRPDVLAEYTVTIYADKTKFPHLLSNGNKMDSGELEDGTHWVKWHDPFNKPCYLFALVAGDFDLLEDSYTRGSGSKVSLQLFVDKGMKSRGQHALDSLKKAMAWDEKVFGLEYDLDIYMIVAVDFFNMGAMENKGLNVFNSKFVLANPATATDEDYFNIESVIAHEYFHNWTGNRVTCRDWFQLSLKEGLTVFRDQQFSADMTSETVNRIKNVKVIREHQFAEDASAMAHPIRPDEVMEMNNFYTVTVYDKGAEVIRMIHTLLGQQGFRRGMDLYFKRHDGQAVTCDDFVNAMQAANSVDLSLFKRWYAQSGTPVVTVSGEYSEAQQSYTLTLSQHTPATADQSEKQALHIPVGIELLATDGGGQAQLVELKSAQQTFQFNAIQEQPTPVVLTNFSAPVKIRASRSADDLINIALHSSDGFSRWDAAQLLYSQYIHNQTPSAETDELIVVNEEHISQLFSGLLSADTADQSLFAEMISLPSIETLAQQVKQFWLTELYDARKSLSNLLANQFLSRWKILLGDVTRVPYQYSNQQVSIRKLKNTVLGYVALTSEGLQVVENHYHKADNMTDTLGALKAAQKGNIALFDGLMQQFETTWKGDPLVMDKWFSLHASTERSDILSRLELLQSHKQFNINNPNRVRSLVGTFAYYNTLGFHAIDGSGYRFVTDYLLKLDAINPQIAARIVTPLTQWHNLDPTRQELVRHQLARLLNHSSLSNDLNEKVSKSLNYKS